MGEGVGISITSRTRARLMPPKRRSHVGQFTTRCPTTWVGMDRGRAWLCFASRFLRGFFSSSGSFFLLAFTKAGGGVFFFFSSSVLCFACLHFPETLPTARR